MTQARNYRIYVRALGVNKEKQYEEKELVFIRAGENIMSAAAFASIDAERMGYKVLGVRDGKELS